MENNELREALQLYKEHTLNLIYSLEKEDYNILEKLLNKRQAVIEDINNMEYTKDEFSKIVEELQILVYQKKLSDLMLEKRGKVRQEINKLNNAKNANHSYNNSLYSGAKVFNKRI